jgi:hypothetical protein
MVSFDLRPNILGPSTRFDSGFLIPIRLNVSQIKFDLIYASRGASVASEGERLTSINHGLIRVNLRLNYLLKI